MSRLLFRVVFDSCVLRPLLMSSRKTQQRIFNFALYVGSHFDDPSCKLFTFCLYFNSSIIVCMPVCACVCVCLLVFACLCAWARFCVFVCVRACVCRCVFLNMGGSVLVSVCVRECLTWLDNFFKQVNIDAPLRPPIILLVRTIVLKRWC